MSIRKHQGDRSNVAFREGFRNRFGLDLRSGRSGLRLLLLGTMALVVAMAGCGGTEDSEPSSITGTWVGNGAGFVDGSPREDLRERLVIGKPVGRAFAGTAEWQADGGRWSQPETIHGTIETDGEVLIIDGDGFLIGHLEGDKLELSYLEQGRVGGGADYAIDYQLERVE